MEDISPIGGVGIGTLLGGVIALLYRFLGTRADPQLLELVRQQTKLLENKDAGDAQIAEAIKAQAQETGALRQAIMGEVGELRKMNQDLRVLNARQGSEIEGQARQIDILTRAQDSLRQDLTTQKAEFAAQNSKDTQEIDRLKACVIESDERFKLATEDREAMEIRVSSLEEQNTDLREQNSTLDKRVAELEAAMKDMQALLVEERKKREQAEAVAASLKKQVAEQDGKLAEKDEEIDRLREANAALVVSLQKKNGEIETP